MTTFTQLYNMEIVNIYGTKFIQYAIFMNFVIVLSYFCIFAFAESTIKSKTQVSTK